MRRQLIGLGMLAAIGLAGAVIVPGPAMGETTTTDPTRAPSVPADRPAFRRLTTGVGRTPAVLPGYLRSAQPVTATVLLAGETVADTVIAERAAGRNPSKAQRSLKRRAVAAAQSTLIRTVQESGVSVLYVMQDAINGAVVRGTRAQIESIRSLPGVLAVQPSRAVMRSNTRANSGTGVPAVWEETGTTGAGQTIAIIDTGVDYTHSTFGGSGNPADFAANDATVVESGTFPTAKVVGGWDFVGDAYDSGSEDLSLLVPNPDADPLDCEGHGTHVAGTAAGLGVNTDGSTYSGPYTELDVASLAIGPGSAPGANLLAYKVFGCDGTTDDAILVAALDRAFREGATVANLSLGSPFGVANDIDTRAVNRVSRAGMLVVASAGNSGHAPYLVGSVSTADRALSVAAFDAVPTLPAAAITFSPSGSLTLQNSNEATFSLSADLYVLDDGLGGIGLGCTADEYPAAVAGKVVVTMRGGCARTDRATLGQAAGAVAVIMVSDAPGYPPVEHEIPAVTIPFLGAEPGAASVLSAANGTTVSLSNTGTIPNPEYLAAASFTSGGPRSGDSAAKPDVSAPGVELLSALVGSGSGGVHASGTSMAAPHTSGIAALVRATHPTWGPAEVKAALMNTATADGLVGYSTRVQGTGLVSATRAVSATVVAVTDDGSNALSFGYRPAGHRVDETRRFTIQNDAPYAVAYDLSAVTNGESWGARLRVEPSQVVVPAGGKRSVKLRVTMDKAALAGLPGVSFNEIDPMDLTTVRGVVQAVPVWNPTLGTAPNPPLWNALRVPFLLVPRGESEIEVGGSRKVGRRGPGGDVFAVRVSNKGVHAGYADVFAWQLSDRRGDASAADDIVSVGMQGFLFDEVTGDQLMVVAVNFAGHRSTAAPREIDLPIDTNSDGTPDYLVFGVDSGFVVDGEPNGVFATFVLRLGDNEIVGAWQGDAPMNGSTVLLPFLASEVGLSAASPTSLRYSVEVLDLLTGGWDGVREWASWNPFEPPVVTGQGALLEPGAKDWLLMTDPGKKAAKAASVKGYLVVTVDDRNGTDQADRINLH